MYDFFCFYRIYYAKNWTAIAWATRMNDKRKHAVGDVIL